jgi:hypothetical protein
MRKTVDVATVKVLANRMILANRSAEARTALFYMAETLVMDAGQYKGFRYVHKDGTGCLPSCVGSVPENGAWSEPEYTQWKDAHLDTSLVQLT